MTRPRRPRAFRLLSQSSVLSVSTVPRVPLCASLLVLLAAGVLNSHGVMAQTAARLPANALPVQASDHVIVGKISDMWVDGAEQMVRYLEVTLDSGGKRLIPMPMAKIHADRVKVSSIPSELFASVPTTRSSTEVTLLEEDKISAFYGGGTLYAADRKKSRWDALR